MRSDATHVTVPDALFPINHVPIEGVLKTCQNPLASFTDGGVRGHEHLIKQISHAPSRNFTSPETTLICGGWLGDVKAKILYCVINMYFLREFRKQL
jgi:hypothetical protein